MDDPMPSDVMGLLRVMNNNNVNGPRNPVLASAVQTNPEMFGTFAKNWLAAAQAAYNEGDASEDMKLLKVFISAMEKAVGQA